MKKIGICFCVVLMLVFVSCSNDSDDDNMVISNKTVAGHWKSVTSHGYDINLNTGEKTEYEEEADESLSFKLYEDGTCLKATTNGTCKILGHELDMFLSYYNEFLQKEMSWTDSYTIEELTSNTMVLSYVGHGHNTSKGEKIYWEWKTTYTMTRVSQ